MSFRRFGVVVLSAVAVMMSACDRFPAQNAIGASLSARGQIEAVYSVCPHERVDRVELVRVVGSIVGDANDVVLWKIERVKGRAPSPDVFVVSLVPSGFRTVVALQHPPAGRDLLAVIVESNQVAGAATTFRVSDLRPNSVVSQGRRFNQEGFLKGALSRCAA